MNILMKLFIYAQETALHIAIEKKNLEFIEILLNQQNIVINTNDKVSFINNTVFHQIL